MTAAAWSWPTPGAWTPRSPSGGWRRTRATRSSPARSTSARRRPASWSASASAASTAAPSSRSSSTPRTSSPTSSWRRRSRPTRMYMGKYPLVSALSRPLITRHLVRVARETGADRDRPRLHRQGQRPGALRGHRDGDRARPDRRGARSASGASRRDAVDRVGQRARHPHPGQEGLAVLDRREPVGPHRRVRDPRGPLGDRRPRRSSSAPLRWPTRPTRSRSSCSTFDRGLPVARRRQGAGPGARSIAEVDRRAGAHGVGRIDMLEDRLVGIKSREIYECPGALTILTAHRDLEDLCLEQELAQEKRGDRGPLRAADLQRPVVHAAEDGAGCVLRLVAALRQRRGAHGDVQGLRRGSPAGAATAACTTTTWPPTTPATSFDQTQAERLRQALGAADQGRGRGARATCSTESLSAHGRLWGGRFAEGRGRAPRRGRWVAASHFDVRLVALRPGRVARACRRAATGSALLTAERPRGASWQALEAIQVEFGRRHVRVPRRRRGSARRDRAAAWSSWRRRPGDGCEPAAAATTRSSSDLRLYLRDAIRRAGRRRCAALQGALADRAEESRSTGSRPATRTCSARSRSPWPPPAGARLGAGPRRGAAGGRRARGWTSRR